MDAQLTIVDTNDQPIATKRRSERLPGDIYRVAALWITNSKGDVLLARRVMTKQRDPGKWGPAVAGTVEANETYESNIYKEAEEEIGLKGQTFAQGPKIFTDTPGDRFFCQGYHVVLDWPTSAFTAQAAEVDAIAWFPREQLLQQLHDTPEKFVVSASRWPELFLQQ